MAVGPAPDAAEALKGAPSLPTTWQDVAGDFGRAYLDLLKASPQWIHISFIVFIAVIVLAILAHRAYVKKLESSQKNSGSNFPADMLVQVITEASSQAHLTAGAITSLSTNVDSLTGEIKKLTEVTKGLDSTVKEIKDIVESTSGGCLYRKEFEPKASRSASN